MSTSTTDTSSGQDAGRTPALRLVRLDHDTDQTRALREAVVRQRVAPDQRRFVTEAVHTLPRADTDPDRTPFAVVLAGARPRDRAEALDRCAGFGIVDLRGHLRDLVDTPERAALLRAYYLTPEWQGRGIGRAACSAPTLDPLVAEVAPRATEIVLCVNRANEAGRRTYLAAGFAPTGRDHHGGPNGPQQILSRPMDPGTSRGANHRNERTENT
ncbi:GNAT family N-acetyltransferase [Nocardiopsis xinjiangensis]|uniref:GNAT family N-acetyltransferase n=1 Tax=Nocardiopsis xinjiangensis TaxID=124285 RepID=UPI00034A05AC|nr:GNAT family N-acetyltransferase [Nocardiopsis xinjiangensis]